MIDSTSRTIVITGATKGLGLALVHAFNKRGHVVAGCGRSAAEVGLLQENPGPIEHFSSVDVLDREAVNDWAQGLIKRIGAPDMLINNAGVMERDMEFCQISADEFDRVVDINIKGAANVLRAFLPAMIAAGSGVLVNFSSGWGRSTSPEVAPYCATKWAIEGLTQALAQELPAGLAAIPLNPGIIDTDMLRGCFGAGADGFPTAETWAESAVPFLAKLGPGDNGRSLSAPGA